MMIGGKGLKRNEAAAKRVRLESLQRTLESLSQQEEARKTQKIINCITFVNNGSMNAPVLLPERQ